MWRNTKYDVAVACKDPLTWISLALLTLMFALTGPFGSYSLLDVWDRLGMWVAVMLVASSFGIVAFFLATHLLPRGIGTVFAFLIASGLTTIPTAFVALWVDYVYLGAPLAGARYWVNLQNLLPVIAIVILLVATSRVGQNVIKLRQTDQPSKGALAPNHMGQPLLYAQAQDHYVKFVTTEGPNLVLMRFSDAITRLGSQEGAQIHRSYWVSRTAIAGVDRKNGKTFVRATDGTHLPVSRTFRANLSALT